MRAWLRSWAVSLRLARRGMWRSKGRSLLIIAMIGVPVLALTFAAVTYDTFSLTREEKIARTMGVSDAIASWWNDQSLDDSSTPTGRQPPPTAKTDERLLALLPPGTKVVRFSKGGSVVRARTATGVGRLTSSYLPVGDPAATGMVKVVQGRAPSADDEISITEAAATRLGAKIGSKVTMLEPAGEFTVTAIVVIPDDLGEFIVFRPDVAVRQEGGQFSGNWLVDLPDGVAPDLPKLRNAGVDLQMRGEQETVDTGTASGTLTLATIAIGLTIFEVVLLCGPAFAVGARRRQRELALVAANGGTAQQLRRVTQADGIVLGLSGAVGGLALGVPLAVLARPLVEEYAVNRLAGSLRFYPTALLAAIALAVFTGFLASLVPAFTAARQNVVAALAGRRGITRSRKRWMALGVVLAAVGSTIAVLGAFAVRAEVILAGLVIGQLGLVVLTPSLIGLLGRFGRSLPLTARIALRDTARNRSSAAPAISAVMAVVAGSVMIGIYYYSNQVLQEEQYQMRLPLGYASVGVQKWDATGPHPLDDALLAKLTSSAQATLPVDRTAVLQTVECADQVAATCEITPVYPEAQQCPYQALPAPGPERDKALADKRCKGGQPWSSGAVGKAVVDDGAHLAMLTGGHGDDLARAQAVLRSGGIVVADPLLLHDGKVDLTVQRPDAGIGKDAAFSLPGYALTSGVPGFGAVVGPGALTGHGLAAKPGMMLIATTRMPTTAEVDAFNEAALDVNSISWVFYEAGPGHPDTDLGLIVLALASAIVTLAATAVVTGLAAADGRADLTTLAAVGASPRVRRFMSLSQSGVIAGLGTVLGLVAGAAGAYAMIFAINRSMLDQRWPNIVTLPMATPWLMMTGALVVPVIAMLGAGLLTRSRLPIERRG